MLRADSRTTLMGQLSSNLGASTSWNPLGLFRPVMGLLHLYHLLLLSPNQHRSTYIPWLFTNYQCSVSQQMTTLLNNVHFYSAVCQQVFMLAACIFIETVILVSDSCYYVEEKVSGRDLCVIHSQRWEFSCVSTEISTGCTY